MDLVVDFNTPLSVIDRQVDKRSSIRMKNI